MSTRRAKDDSQFHQNRYASSAEFERGLLANLVAKRCALIDSPATRGLIWFVQYLSHQEGGVSRLAKELIEKFPSQLQTETMCELKLKRGKICTDSQHKNATRGMPSEAIYGLFVKPLEGEKALKDILRSRPRYSEEMVIPEDEDATPKNLKTDELFDCCLNHATRFLEKDISEICLNPELETSKGPWYFPNLFGALHEHLNDYQKSKSAAFTTTLGKKVSEVLDYTAFGGGLTLMEGDARTGKSFAAHNWCEQRPGQARFAEVPPGNDETGFFRALARALGLGNFLSYKGSQIRDRVESVLLTKNLLLVLDEAQRLWPQYNSNRYSYPTRITWVMTMANAGVPIAMISTPQFIEIQKGVERNGWNSRQLTGRLRHYEPLLGELSHEDLTGVARAVLPEANKDVLKALAIYARSSARYLAAIDSIAARARYLAMKDERATATTADVQKAMKESVIPADSNLQSALAKGQSAKRIKNSSPYVPLTPETIPQRPNNFLPPSDRSIAPATQTAEAPLIGV